MQHVPETHAACVVWRFRHQGDVADGRVGGRGIRCRRLRRAEVSRCGRRGARLRPRCDFVESLCAEDAAKALRQFGGQLVRVDAGLRRLRGAMVVLHGGDMRAVVAVVVRRVVESRSRVGVAGVGGIN